MRPRRKKYDRMTSTATDIAPEKALQRLLREAIEGPESGDPQELARRVISHIDDIATLQELLVAALTPGVRRAMVNRRNTLVGKVFEPARTSPASLPDSATCPDQSPQQDSTLSRYRQQNLRAAPESTKVRTIRDEWARHLATKVRLPNTGWKPLGECTASDLLSLEQHHRGNAAAQVRAAENIGRLRRLLMAHQVQTVSQIPQDELHKALPSA